ncbi:hypothetical protein KCP69_16670 [Salmonella enterica subsp. enterica]|nr:hypothetical protein KCP69_16670 [Salmonella enterica subsp. enterica]
MSIIMMGRVYMARGMPKRSKACKRVIVQMCCFGQRNAGDAANLCYQQLGKMPSGRSFYVAPLRRIPVLALS